MDLESRLPTESQTARTNHSPTLLNPLASAAAGLTGFLLICLGVAIDVYRHKHDAGAAEVISFSSPGMLLALGGVAIAGLSLLVTVSLLALRDAPTPGVVARRAVGVGAAWVTATASAIAVVTYLATAGVTIGHDGHTTAARTSTPVATDPDIATTRATFHGTLTLDGAPLGAQFLGARVTRDGLTAACQFDIPDVSEGQYEIRVMADAEVRGCGVDGAEVFLWTSLNDGLAYTEISTTWPGDGEIESFDATFSSAAPQGVSRPATAFYGLASTADGTLVAGGTLIEAFVGDVRCGFTSTRSEGFDGFILYVVGPDSIPGCTRDAQLTFQIGGRLAAQTAINDLLEDRDGEDEMLRLSLP